MHKRCRVGFPVILSISLQATCVTHTLNMFVFTKLLILYEVGHEMLGTAPVADRAVAGFEEVVCLADQHEAVIRTIRVTVGWIPEMFSASLQNKVHPRGHWGSNSTPSRLAAWLDLLASGSSVYRIPADRKIGSTASLRRWLVHVVALLVHSTTLRLTVLLQTAISRLTCCRIRVPTCL